MDAHLVANLERFVSAPRLQRYREASASELETALLYCWNIQLAEALIPSLALFEVALRNAVHETLTIYAQTDWWFGSVLHPASYANIQKLTNRLTTIQGPPTSGKVISEITFGFWQKLFAKSYSSLWWGSQAPRLLPQVIPNHPNVARDTRSKLEERLEYFVTVRNRVVHQEAVFEGVGAPNRSIRPIEIVHSELIETLEWIDLDAAAMAKCLDRFDDVCDSSGKDQLEQAIKTKFHIP